MGLLPIIRKQIRRGLGGIGVQPVPGRLRPQKLRVCSGPSELPEAGDPGSELLRLLRVEPRLFKETAAPGDVASEDLSGRRFPETDAFALRPECETQVPHETDLGEKVALRSPRSRGAHGNLECRT